MRFAEPTGAAFHDFKQNSAEQCVMYRREITHQITSHTEIDQLMRVELHSHVIDLIKPRFYLRLQGLIKIQRETHLA